MTPLIAVLFAIMQGATELFPVSSLGHAVIVPALLHWHIDQHAPSFLPFVVMLHVGTATALLAYFWRDWWDMLMGLLGRGTGVNEQRGLLLRLVVATIPAVVIGFILKKPIQHLFASPLIAAVFLIVNGGLLLAGEQLRRRKAARGMGIAQLTLVDAFVIGLFQCLAFLPGLSRSGAAIVGGLTRGIDHEAAARFAFLMATPVIAGATVVEVPKLLHHHSASHGMFGLAVLAAVVAGLVAFGSTAFLMRYFRDHDRWALGPFAAYCAVFGVLSLVLLTAGI
ncbi:MULTISPECIES: undecaprenyl-diphosphate phosphatase [Acidiphilium]|uniref:Undecaprenyl-diphosphatase n=1 Tax=Acidiphilium rubrum TaxID=526 RepID=A0A8G2CM32_ACIRU|nr:MULTISPECIES: undecaprenyl-diphosphate phosphatase [Acidiphilium]OYW02055.1 MAG: undecaprenyl-diphosphatase [Acidiphilium sp. 37-64-53]OZB30557.1 MAG: undecaprenyl-diphosphatase [Acidiphilium sp. 34-64-41]SIR15615.1 undecaprenyl-diphosphatase [Acidiphilium rubrum]HQT84624.1 undecaprenyl-diphosphate phosphatase [Acidiphilium rubrum]